MPVAPQPNGPQAVPPLLQTYNHPYAAACTTKPLEYHDYENFSIEWGDSEPYILHRKIGRGKYSEVFTATNRFNGRPCVVKVLKPVKEKRLNREVLILQNLCGVPNVITLLDMMFNDETATPSFAFEYVRNVDYRDLYPTFSDLDVRYYMFELLRTLDICHSLGIMHRDVKPQNICIDHSTRKLRLIDWGLAEFYHPDQTYNVRVASRYYKGPELLVGFRRYDYSLDMWSLGCMFAAIIFKRDPFFHGQDNEDQLVQIVRVLGTEALLEYVHGLSLPITNIPEHLVTYPVQRRPWSSFVRSTTPLATPEAIEFCDKLLVMDHTKRVLPSDAMKLAYFDPVRHLFPPQGSMAPTQPPASPQ